MAHGIDSQPLNKQKIQNSNFDTPTLTFYTSCLLLSKQYTDKEDVVCEV